MADDICVLTLNIFKVGFDEIYGTNYTLCSKEMNNQFYAYIFTHAVK